MSMIDKGIVVIRQFTGWADFQIEFSSKIT